MIGTQARPNDDDMPAEIDFSKGTRGKFFKPGTRLNLPVYLEAEVQAYLADRTKARGIEVAQLVNAQEGHRVDRGGQVEQRRFSGLLAGMQDLTPAFLVMGCKS
jgi:hypothetical protein